MARSVIKADISPVREWCAKNYTDPRSYMWIPVAIAFLVGAFGSSIAMWGSDYGAHPTTALVFFVIALISGLFALGNALLASGTTIKWDVYDSKPITAKATDVYRMLNKDNQVIALPTIKWLYQNADAQDSNGYFLYRKATEKRMNALNELLSEQVRHERLQASDNTSDLEALEHYTKILSDARTMYKELSV